MGRPATQHEARKALIIQAALDCFARYGYEGTSNKLIAQAAGLNSAALIYHYFPSKEDLFRACLYSFSIMDELKVVLEKGTDRPPEEYLTLVATTYLQILRQPTLSKLIPIMLGSLQSHPELVPLLTERIEAVIWLPVSKYLDHQMELGVIRRMSSGSTLQIFLGPLVVRLISNIFLGSTSVLDADDDSLFVKRLVKTFLEGCKIENPSA
jgi:AcrR family transcriptional regulator